MTDRESELIERLMQGDLENKADSYAEIISRGLDPECSTADVVRQKIAEAYKQGYEDANTFICYARLCRDRMISDELEEETD